MFAGYKIAVRPSISSSWLVYGLAFYLPMLKITLTSAARQALLKALETERVTNPHAVFRIRETRRGVYNDAVYELRLGLDESSDNDEITECGGIPFVADREFLAMYGEPTFYVVTEPGGKPSVHPMPS